MITLYHGSVVAVSKPLANIGRSDLDFGQGFYLTSLKEQAEKWARIKSERHKNNIPTLNVYELDDLGLSCATYRALKFESYNKEWLDFIASSRKGKRPWEGYDYIEGGIANDSVITTVDLYVDGLISVEQALDKLVNEELRHQLCILNQGIIDQYLVFKESIDLK